ncbi:MAG: PilZ domain-containing protein [Labilithrix sp.]|nr:PilZ domain-containing protein [Labilithrix sp.]MCW5833504.1 PilZ domain-containing protein [Labilithrix sp.]
MPLFVRKNERREVRRALVMPCQIVRERDFRLVAEEALDVSPDGMLVSSDVELDPGENVFVSFRATELGIWFDTEARVARVIRGRRPGDRGRGIALRFSTMPRVKRFILRGHLRNVPPPVPRRAQRIDWAATVRSIVT